MLMGTAHRHRSAPREEPVQERAHGDVSSFTTPYTLRPNHAPVRHVNTVENTNASCCGWAAKRTRCWEASTVSTAPCKHTQSVSQARPPRTGDARRAVCLPALTRAYDGDQDAEREERPEEAQRPPRVPERPVELYRLIAEPRHAQREATSSDARGGGRHGGRAQHKPRAVCVRRPQRLVTCHNATTDGAPPARCRRSPRMAGASAGLQHEARGLASAETRYNPLARRAAGLKSHQDATCRSSEDDDDDELVSQSVRAAPRRCQRDVPLCRA